MHKLKTNLNNQKNKTWIKLIFGFFIFFFSISFFFILKNTAFAQNADDFGGISNETLNNVGASEEAIEKLNKTGFGPDSPLNNDEACSIWRLPRCFILVMFKFAGWLLILSSSIFSWIIDTNNIKYIISDNTAIYSSWTFVRDILNMAFIMMLLFSAFCTIFQVESYNYKKMLWKIVLMALLVNFSFPIARFIIDASNILMYSLMKPLFETGGTGTPAFNSIGIITEGSGLNALIKDDTRNITNTLLLANTVLIFMLAITFLAIGILLLIRLIALAILIIFSPIAFVGSIMPGVSSYASQWWDNLFKYSFFGPIMIFGISIAVKLMTDTANMEKIRALSKSAATAQVGSQATDPTFLGQIGIAAIPIVLLWMVMGVAQKMSIAGAGAVMGAAQKAMKWSGGLPWRGIKTLSRKIDRDYIGVRGTIQAWKDRAAELEKTKVGKQAARGRDWLNSVFDRGKKPSTFYRDVYHENMVAQYQKEQDFFSTTDVEIIAALKNLEGKTDLESRQRKQAFLRSLARGKDLNEFEKLYQKKEFDPYTAKEDIYKFLGKNAEAVEALHDLEDINLTNGVYSLYGLTHYITEAETIDEKTGEVIKGMKGDSQRIGQRRISTNAEQKAAALTKMRQVDYQKFMISMHRDTIVKEDLNSQTIGLNDMGEEVLLFIESQDAKYVDRWRGENKEHVLKAIETNPALKSKLPKLIAALEGKKQTEEPKIEAVGGSFSSRGDKTKFDDKGNRIT